MSIEAIKAQLELGIAENETDVQELQAGAAALAGAIPLSEQARGTISDVVAQHGNGYAELVDVSASMQRSIEHLKHAQAETASVSLSQHNAVAWTQQAVSATKVLVGQATSLMEHVWGPEDALAARTVRAAEAAGKATAIYAQVVEGEPVVKQAAGHSREAEKIQESVVQLAGEVEKVQARAEWMHERSHNAAKAVVHLEAEAAQIMRNISEVHASLQTFLGKAVERRQDSEAMLEQLRIMQKEQADISVRLTEVMRDIGQARVSGLQTIDMAQTRHGSL